VSEQLLQARGLHAFYGDSHILHGVDFGIRRGEAVGLMGRNGMGKSTLLKSLVGVVPPRRGEVSVGGRSTRGMKIHQVARLGIAYVPEGRGIFASLSVRENLMVSARPGVDGRSDWTFERVLDVFPRLAERLGHGGQQLSGGEQQMLTIGRALMTNPRLLILDEATEGLAPLVALEIWRIIGLVRDAGIATILVDKNWKAVIDNTDRSVILVKGRVVFEGAGEQLRSRPDRLADYLGI
jgi:branched-chain amino acid transport system ATP-binding protein